MALEQRPTLYEDDVGEYEELPYHVSPRLSPASPLYYEHVPVPLQRSRPSVTLRVVDGTGRVSEVPVNFHSARIEPRGFWGDVAVNGMALFIASAFIIMVKEGLSWLASRRSRARASAHRTLAAQRRATISSQLEGVDLELRKLRTTGADEREDDLELTAKRLLNLLDAYREELRDYDAPALMAYLENLEEQVSQLSAKSSKLHSKQASSESFGVGPRETHNDAVESTTSSDVNTQRWTGAALTTTASASPSHATSASSRSWSPSQLQIKGSFFDSSRAEDEDAGKADSKRPLKAEGQTTPKPQKAERDMWPNLELVQRLSKQNPGMASSEVLRLAKDITLVEQTQERG